VNKKNLRNIESSYKTMELALRKEKRVYGAWCMDFCAQPTFLYYQNLKTDAAAIYCRGHHSPIPKI